MFRIEGRGMRHDRSGMNTVVLNGSSGMVFRRRREDRDESEEMCARNGCLALWKTEIEQLVDGADSKKFDRDRKRTHTRRPACNIQEGMNGRHILQYCTQRS